MGRKLKPVCVNSYNHGYSEHKYSYTLQGITRTFIIKKWYDINSNKKYVCAVVLDRNGVIFDYAFGPTYDRKRRKQLLGTEWGQVKANAVIARDAGVEFPLYLERGFDPARDILDGWWNLSGFSGLRPRLTADDLLDNL